MSATHHQLRMGRPPLKVLATGLLSLAACLVTAQAADAIRVFRSTDGGRSWSRSDRGLPDNARLNAFGSVDDSMLAGTDSGIFLSRDQGQRWQTSTGAASSSSRAVTFAALGRRAFAGTDRSGLLESSDQGATWAVNERFPSKNVRSLLAHQGTLYAGTDAEGVFLSKDNGRSWEQVHQGLPPNAQVFDLAALKGTVFAGLYSKGLYKWDERVHCWSKTGPVSPLVLATIGDTLVAGHNPGGIYTSDDLGATWAKAAASPLGNLTTLVPDQHGELSSDAPVWELASSTTRVFAGAGSGIYYSEDNGRAWLRAREGLPEASPAVAFLIREDLVLAATLGRDKADSLQSTDGRFSQKPTAADR